MASSQSVYSFKGVTVALGPFHIIGFAEEATDHVKITPKQDKVTMIVGSDGRNNIINVMEDNTAEVEIKLIANSRSNIELTSAFNVLTNGLVLTGLPLIIRDANSSDLFVGQDAVITNMPEVSYGSTSQIRTWKFLVSNVLYKLGPLL